jgi:hypothetical protein
LINLSEFQKKQCIKLLNILQEDGINILLLFPGVNIAYYTGFIMDMSERLAAAVIPLEGEPYFVLNKLEANYAA